MYKYKYKYQRLNTADKIMNLNSIVNITWMSEETSIVVAMHLLAATPENAFNETETVE